MTRRDFLRLSLGAGTALGLGGSGRAQPRCTVAPEGIPTGRSNVVLIAVDDLRPSLGCYGDPVSVTPNIDRLAAEGTLFERAYCQQPVCMASRASLLSGYRPSHAGIASNRPLADLLPNVTTLNLHFERHGYLTHALGKIYHHRVDHLRQFTDARWQFGRNADGHRYQSDEAQALWERTGAGPAYESAAVADTAYGDGDRARRAVEQLRRFAESDPPFFLFVGFTKPHLAFTAPARYWELYDTDGIPLPEPAPRPTRSTPNTRYNFEELRAYHGIPDGQTPIPETLARTLKHGYYACTSFVDAQVGTILDEIDRAGLADSTLVVLVGDHGFKLGEHGAWSKHTLYHHDAHVPLIVRLPGGTPARSPSVVELVDLYPTLCDLCALPRPEHLQGRSLLDTLERPACSLRAAAFTQTTIGPAMGYSVTTERYRYIEWFDSRLPGWVTARELYDLHADPNEHRNLTAVPGNLSLTRSLSRLLDRGEGWRQLARTDGAHSMRVSEQR